jgi:hypothetical protein
MIDKIFAVHDALDHAGVPHAFGGAIALGYCLRHPRGTVDIDVNVFVGTEQARAVFDALPTGVTWGEDDLLTTERDEQVRLWWDETAVDLFFVADAFHVDTGRRAREVELVGLPLPVLDCVSLAVFKALYNRTKDWADLEAMSKSGTLDVEQVAGWLTRLLGNDERIDHLRAIADLPPEDDDSPGQSFRDLLEGR